MHDVTNSLTFFLQILCTKLAFYLHVSCPSAIISITFTLHGFCLTMYVTECT